MLFLKQVIKFFCVKLIIKTIIEEYEINAGGFIAGASVSVMEGDNLILNFVGGGFEDWVFIWTGPNSLYQVIDTGDGNARDRLNLNNIQTNQTGEYKVVYYDDVGCVDSTSFMVNVFNPEICDNGVDDDGDGDIDCADNDCVTTNYAVTQTSAGVLNPNNVLGATDDQFAIASQGDTMVIDLGNAIDINYGYFIRALGNNMNLTVEESIDGINYFTNSASPISMTIPVSASYSITSEVHTRYLRLTFTETAPLGTLELDAIFNLDCICQPSIPTVEEYQINLGANIIGSNVTAVQGNLVRLEFSGTSYDTWTFIWSGPNAVYQINSTGTNRDRLVLPNIQANQAGEYKVYYFDDSGCADSTSFNLTVLTPEICNNGIDDDGDGNIDCEDGDCPGLDTDGDGICDDYDLDDDNDGIPDLDEGHCEVSQFAFESDTEGWVQDNTNNGSSEGPTVHSSGVVTWEGCTMSNIPANPDGNFIMADDTYGQQMHFESPNNLNLDLSSKLNGTFSFNWIGGTYDGVSGTQSPQVGNMDVFLIGSGITINATFDVTGLSNTGVWTTFTFTLDDATWSGTAADLSTVLSDLDRIEIEVESITSQDWSVADCTDGEYFGLGNIAFKCDSRDSDNDLVPDYLDLDSDNDGIYDVVEAGHGLPDANRDGMIDGVSSAFGINGLFDGVEMVVDNGILNYSISDSETTPDGIYDAYEIDADGDGCFDTIEANRADSEQDGIAGTGIPVVNGSGLINGLNYNNIPPNSNWQNPLIIVCCNAQAPTLSKN